jgi:uncharacterized protein YciI
MAAGNVYKVRYHCVETVTSGGAFVSDNNADTEVLVAGTTQAAALALVPAAPAVVAGHTNTVVIDEVSTVEQNVILS